MSPDAGDDIWFGDARPHPQALALRYRVYCEEFSYLPAVDYPAGLESDDDDAAAAHFHLFETHPLDDVDPAAVAWKDAAPANLTGYVRLVRPDARGMLPVQRRCQLTLDTSDAVADPRACAEVSRLIIAPEFRRQRYGMAAKAKPSFVHRRAARALSTDLLLQLFSQMFDYSRLHGIRYWFAAMERPLARSLGQMGFPFKVAGPEGEFFGRVTPYVADLHDLQLRVTERQPRLAQWFLAPRPQGGACSGASASLRSPVWAHQPPPPQLWRADA